MTTPDDELDAILNAPPAPAPRPSRVPETLWRRELPYFVILALAAAGAGYVSLTRQPIVRYWDVVAVVVAVVAVVEGWGRARDGAGRWRLVWTQALHWAAFLLAMNLVFLPSLQAVLNQDSTSLTVLLLLALGTFVSGVHTLSPLMCLNGLFMALCVPAIAWLDQTALIIGLVVVLLAAIAGLVLWLRRARRRA